MCFYAWYKIIGNKLPRMKKIMGCVELGKWFGEIVCGVIFNVRIGKDFGLKNSVFYIRTVLTENNRFLCIFSFTVFIVNEYFTTVTKLRICAHHLLLTIILSIPKCVTLYQVTIIPSYLYSEMRELKIFNTSHFVTWLFSEL
jgi:hypothetical protein